jgi:hypothetical protein
VTRKNREALIAALKDVYRHQVSPYVLADQNTAFMHRRNVWDATVTAIVTEIEKVNGNFDRMEFRRRLGAT